MLIKKRLGILLIFLTFTCINFQTFGFLYPEDYNDLYGLDSESKDESSWLRVPSWLKRPSWLCWPGWPSSWVGRFIKKSLVENEELDVLVNEGQKKLKQCANDLAKVAKDHVEEVVDFVYDRYKKAALYTFLGIGTIIGTWYGSKFLANSINRKLKRQFLIDESSFKTVWQKLRSYIQKEKMQIRQMVFHPDIEVRLNNVIASTRKIVNQIKQGKTNVKFRNLFLYGPPGTGKTMFARELPKKIGIPYVFISGASFSQFKNGEGIAAMNELFSWAYKNKDGFILIIDDADSFLYNRENMEPNSEEYQLISNFLKWTGTRNDKFMIVLCANYKDKMDPALRSRIDDYIEMTLPGLEERKKVLTLYKNQILLDIEQGTQEFINSVNEFLSDCKILEIASSTDGFSNRELEGIINNIKNNADISQNGLVTQTIVDSVVSQALEKYYSLTGKKR